MKTSNYFGKDVYLAAMPVSCVPTVPLPNTKQLTMKTIFALAALLVSMSPVFAGDLPDPLLTPGVINTDVTQDSVHGTVCVRGWTKTVRPDRFYTNSLKKSQLRQLGYADRDPRHYEEDHLVPLSLGGHPSDPRNLWPQPRQSEWNADRKDELEFALYMGVCHNQVSLAEARQAMASNWIAAYRRYLPLMQRYHSGHGE